MQWVCNLCGVLTSVLAKGEHAASFLDQARHCLSLHYMCVCVHARILTT